MACGVAGWDEQRSFEGRWNPKTLKLHVIFRPSQGCQRAPFSQHFLGIDLELLRSSAPRQDDILILGNRDFARNVYSDAVLTRLYVDISDRNDKWHSGRAFPRHLGVLDYVKRIMTALL